MSTLPVDYGPFVTELNRLAALRRQPLNGAFELTARCNLACRMCYVRHATGDSAQRALELSAPEWLALAREAKDNGLLFLLLTGGEVFLRPDFFEIYEPLTRMGLVLTLFTNGTLINREVAARLAQAPPSRTEITLYGATAATYEAVTGVPGSFERCCAGIETLAAHRIPLGLKTTITRQNVGELEAMRLMAHDWGVPFSASWLLSSRSDGSPSEVGECRLAARDSAALEATHEASALELNEIGLRESDFSSDTNFYCQAGKSAFVVNPAGQMNVCIDLPRPSVKPLEVGFAEAWRQVQAYVDRTPPPASTCQTCEDRDYCLRCPAWSLMETGTLTDPVPYLCEIASARRQRYDLDHLSESVNDE